MPRLFPDLVCDQCRPALESMHKEVWRSAGIIDGLGEDRAELASLLNRCLPIVKRLQVEVAEAALKVSDHTTESLQRLVSEMESRVNEFLPDIEKWLTKGS